MCDTVVDLTLGRRMKAKDELIAELQATLKRIDVDNMVASLHNAELWGIHGDLQKEIDTLLAGGE